MRRFYYFGCRGSDLGHYLHGAAHPDYLDGGFPAHLLDGVFAPIDANDRGWKLTHLRFAGHVVSILAKHDNTIDKRGGSNACFVAIDDGPLDETTILGEARKRFPDCWERLTSAKPCAECSCTSGPPDWRPAGTHYDDCPFAVSPQMQGRDAFSNLFPDEMPGEKEAKELIADLKEEAGRFRVQDVGADGVLLRAAKALEWYIEAHRTNLEVIANAANDLKTTLAMRHAPTVDRNLRAALASARLSLKLFPDSQSAREAVQHYEAKIASIVMGDEGGTSGTETKK